MTYSEHNKNIGKIFGKLTVEYVFRKYTGGMERVHYLCKCDCGKTKVIIAYNVSSGKTLSCGCLVPEKNKLLRSRTTHGMKNTPEYKAYMQAKTRCNNKSSPDYHYYGGRGILFKFTSFEEFYKEIGNKPNQLYQIDRIDNNGNYEKGNIRWVTKSQNCLNRRTSIKNKL